MSRKKILIVDDLGELRKLIRMTLEFGDYELHEADNGVRALELVESIKPDLIVLDVMMPGELDGFQVCERIKQDKKTREIHVLLLTARGQKSDVEKGKSVGANSYLVKPFSPLELIELIQKELE